MRNYLMPLADKIMLRKRFVIETVLDTLKSEMGLEHSRHRSPVNAMVHVLSLSLTPSCPEALIFLNNNISRLSVVEVICSDCHHRTARAQNHCNRG